MHTSLSLYRCMYVCIYIYINKQTKIYIYIYIYIYVYTHMYTHIRMYIHIGAGLHDDERHLPTLVTASLTQINKQIKQSASNDTHTNIELHIERNE